MFYSNKKIFISLYLLFASFFSSLSSAEEEASRRYSIRFNDISILEFIHFVSKISETNFIFDKQDLEFNVTIAFAKPMSSDDVLKALVQMLRLRGFAVMQENGYLAIHKNGKGDAGTIDQKTFSIPHSLVLPASANRMEKYEFETYKLQYHPGEQIQEALKKIGSDLSKQPDPPKRLLNAIETIQWIKATNSLFCSSDEETLQDVRRLVDSLDVPLRQVFIEVLVIETDVRKGLDFGLQWGAGGQI